jgi:hypothetical protein
MLAAWTCAEQSEVSFGCLCYSRTDVAALKYPLRASSLRITKPGSLVNSVPDARPMRRQSASSPSPTVPVVPSKEARTVTLKSARGLTHVLTTATAAMVLATACSSTTFKQVRGTVVDERTGKPVADARVEATATQAATVTGSTDALGRFTLHKVSKQATVKVTAANYQLASLRATQGPLEVKLTPIPVVGQITSRLTQAGLHAALRGKLGRQFQTRPDGTFTLYGIGKGDTLTVSAPEHLTKSVTIGAGRVEVALNPKPATEVEQIHRWLRAGNLAAVWRFIFTDPPGYQFREAPADFETKASKAYGVDRPEVKDVEVRVVSNNSGSDLITVIAVAYDPEFAARPGFRVSFPPRLTSLARPQMFTVARVRVPYIALPVPGEHVARLLLDGTVMLLLESRDLNATKALVAALFDARA